MSKLILTLSLAAFLVALAIPNSAGAALMGYNAIGQGSASDNCPGGNTCTATMNTSVKGRLGSAAYSTGKFSVSLTVVSSESIDNGGQGACSPASGTGSIINLPGGTINFSTVGLYCDVGYSGGPKNYNGTYFVTGGTSKNLNAQGTGTVATSIYSGKLWAAIFGVVQR